MKSLLSSACVCLTLVFAAATCNAADSGKKEAAKPINKVCPVEGGEVDSTVTVEHEGKTVAFCCAGCDETFKKDPAKYMAIIAKEQKAAPAKDAKKADADKKEEAKLNTKCPVSDDDADESLTKEYKGRTIAFCCDGCVKDFDKDPKKYVAKLEAAEKAEKAEKKDEAKPKK